MIKVSLKQFIGYGFAVVFQKFSAFLILPFLTASLTVQEFGIVNQLIYFAGVVILIVMLGIDEAVAKKGFDSESGVNPFLLSAILILAFNGLIFILLVLLTKGTIYSDIIGVTDSNLMVLSMVYIFFTPFYYSYLKILRLSKNSKKFFYLTVVTSIIQSILLIVLVIIFKLGALGYLLSYAMAMFLIFFYIMYIIKSQLTLNYYSFNKAIILIKYGLSVAPHTVSTWGLLGFTVVSIGSVLGHEASAKFVTINYIPTIASVASYAFFFTFQPWLYDNLKGKTNTLLLYKKGLQFLIIFFLFLLVLYIFSEKIYDLLFPSIYVFDMDVFLILIAAVFFQFLSSMFTYVLYYFEKYTKFVSISTIIGVFVNIGLFYLLVPLNGLIGASMALLTANIVMMIVRLYIMLVALKNYEQKIKHVKV